MNAYVEWVCNLHSWFAERFKIRMCHLLILYNYLQTFNIIAARANAFYTTLLLRARNMSCGEREERNLFVGQVNLLGGLGGGLLLNPIRTLAPKRHQLALGAAGLVTCQVTGQLQPVAAPTRTAYLGLSLLHPLLSLLKALLHGGGEGLSLQSATSSLQRLAAASSSPQP